jgi:hypothetical protein
MSSAIGSADASSEPICLRDWQSLWLHLPWLSQRDNQIKLFSLENEHLEHSPTQNEHSKVLRFILATKNLPPKPLRWSIRGRFSFAGTMNHYGKEKPSPVALRWSIGGRFSFAGTYSNLSISHLENAHHAHSPKLEK